MNFQFSKHYTIEEARGLLPLIRDWLNQLDQLRKRLHQYDRRLSALLEAGCDVGGEAANGWVRTLSDLQDILFRFEQRQIQIKDMERGLIDFPAVMNGKEVFLCWEKDEEDIEFWHDIDTGYAGRERL